MHWKQSLLESGKTFETSERGHSMEPRLHDKQIHELTPANLTTVEVDDIVFCSVGGKYFTHLVKEKDPQKGVLIGNNKGKLNGWTHNVYGKVSKIVDRI